jgi:sec-independent protein translocase protein TatA
MPHIGFAELVIIMVVILLLFGAKRIPEIAGSMGKGIKEFKKQMNEAQRELGGDSYSSPRLTGEDLNRPVHNVADEEKAPEPRRLL